MLLLVELVARSVVAESLLSLKSLAIRVAMVVLLDRSLPRVGRKNGRGKEKNFSRASPCVRQVGRSAITQTWVRQVVIAEVLAVRLRASTVAS